MEQFRERINSACTTIRSATATWIENGAALLRWPEGDPGDLVGASMVVTYVHDGGPLVLPGSDRVYKPSGKDLVLNVSDAVRIDSDGMITDRWSGLSFAHLHWQLELNATLYLSQARERGAEECSSHCLGGRWRQRRPEARHEAAAASGTIGSEGKTARPGRGCPCLRPGGPCRGG